MAITAARNVIMPSAYNGSTNVPGAGSMETDQITLNGSTYKIIVNTNGSKSLLRFNAKCKMWVKLNFSQKSQPNSIIDVLSKQYITRMTS